MLYLIAGLLSQDVHELLKRGINGIGMIKQTEKVYFRYRGWEMDVKRLYATLKQKSATSQRISIICTVPLCNTIWTVQRWPWSWFSWLKRCQGSLLVLATTKTNWRPERIIQMYGRRWQIEGYFKIAKQYLAGLRHKYVAMTALRTYGNGHDELYLLALCQRGRNWRTHAGWLVLLLWKVTWYRHCASLDWLMTQLIGIVNLSVAQVVINQIMSEFMQNCRSKSLCRSLRQRGDKFEYDLWIHSLTQRQSEPFLCFHSLVKG